MSPRLVTALKCSLLTVNFFFVITGIILLYVGISVQLLYDEYFIFMPHDFYLPAFCIAAGALIFLIAANGLYGIIMENYLIKMLFAGAMVVMLLFQLPACIAAFAIRGSTLDNIQVQLTWTQNIYGPDHSYEVTQQWDKLQEKFQCCGVLNASDWLIPLNTQYSLALPLSCCSQGHGTVEYCTVPKAFPKGCSEPFGQFVAARLDLMGIAGVFLTLMQGLIVLNVVTALWMVKLARENCA